MKFRDDDRGLALAIVVFFGMLVIGALLYLLMEPAMTEVFGFSTGQAESSGATDQITMAQSIWNNLLYVVIFLSMLFLIARAVREGGIGR